MITVTAPNHRGMLSSSVSQILHCEPTISRTVCEPPQAALLRPPTRPRSQSIYLSSYPHTAGFPHCPTPAIFVLAPRPIHYLVPETTIRVSPLLENLRKPDSRLDARIGIASRAHAEETHTGPSGPCGMRRVLCSSPVPRREHLCSSQVTPSGSRPPDVTCAFASLITVLRTVNDHTRRSPKTAEIPISLYRGG